jgi:NADH-quinone oxidoreductase subunit H
MSGSLKLLKLINVILEHVYKFLGLTNPIPEVINAFITAAISFAVISVFVMFLVWMERKVSAHMQSRIGPNRVGPFGLLQTLADAIKLTTKENMEPQKRDKIPYFIAPIIAFVATFMGVVVIPLDKGVTIQNLNIGVLYIIAITSFTVIGILTAGWSSNNKFSLIGGFRSAAQIISYEIPLVLSLVPVIMITGTLDLQKIVEYQAHAGYWFVGPQIIGFLVFLTASTAESNRAPFDIPEAESELTGGFHTEYSGIKFAMFFLGEYISIIIGSSVAVSVFLGGWIAPAFMNFLPVPGFFWFVIKVLLVIYLIMAFRWTFPRLRVDQLMDFGWKILIPIAILNIFLTGLWILWFSKGV